MPAHTGAESLKKHHHIITLRFSEVVNDHAKCLTVGRSFDKSLFRKALITNLWLIDLGCTELEVSGFLGRCKLGSPNHKKK